MRGMGGRVLRGQRYVFFELWNYGGCDYAGMRLCEDAGIGGFYLLDVDVTNCSAGNALTDVSTGFTIHLHTSFI